MWLSLIIVVANHIMCMSLRLIIVVVVECISMLVVVLRCWLSPISVDID